MRVSPAKNKRRTAVERQKQKYCASQKWCWPDSKNNYRFTAKVTRLGIGKNVGCCSRDFGH